MSDHNAEIVKKWDELKARKLDKNNRLTALSAEFGMTKKALSEVLKSEGAWYDRKPKKSKLDDVKMRAKKASLIKKMVHTSQNFQLPQNTHEIKSDNIQEILSLLIWSLLFIFTIISLIVGFFN